MSAELAGIGHNEPPTDIEIVGEVFKERYAENLAQAERLAEKAKQMPEAISDDETAGKVGDLIKQITASMKGLDAARVGEKEPYLAKGRAVDGFFKRYTELLKECKDRLAGPHGEYIKRRDEEKRLAEQRKREEEADRLRQETEAKLREAERLRLEAEEARRVQEEEARKAREAAEAERKRIAEETAKAAKAQQDEIDRLKREQEEKDRLAREEIAKMKAEADKKDLEQKAALEEAERARKAEAEEAKRKLKEAEETAKQIERDRREQEIEARKNEREQEKTLADMSRAAAATERESDRMLNEAVKTDKMAEKMQHKASQTAHSKFVKIRGEQGSLSTFRSPWVGVVTSREEIDLEKLRHHLPEDALNKAIQSFVDAGGRELKGAYIHQETTSVVR